MKIKCQECETIVEIDESEFPVGIEQTIECPLCQNEISFTVNPVQETDVEENTTDSLPPSPPTTKVTKKVKSRKVKKGNAQQPNKSLRDPHNDDLTNNHINGDTGVDDTTIKMGGIYTFTYYLGYYHDYIKKGLIAIVILAVLIFFGKLFLNSQSQPSNLVDSDMIEKKDNEIIADEVINEGDSIISFLTTMYKNSSYVSYPFLNRHCTQRLLSKLSEAYDYDCNESPCYATWLFRTSAQDVKSSTEKESGVMSVRNMGNNWFEVEFYDNGWKGIKRIKAFYKDNTVMMDIIETVYDEAAENLKDVQEVADSTVASQNSAGYIKDLSERKLTEKDIDNFSTQQLQLLRNMIFAWHGYKFNKEELFSYFSKYQWYHPTTTDDSNIYENLSEIEKYNVDFIRAHE